MKLFYLFDFMLFYNSFSYSRLAFWPATKTIMHAQEIKKHLDFGICILHKKYGHWRKSFLFSRLSSCFSSQSLSSVALIYGQFCSCNDLDLLELASVRGVGISALLVTWWATQYNVLPVKQVGSLY